MKATATWLAIDAASPDAAMAVTELMGKPTVITAELGGLQYRLEALPGGGREAPLAVVE